MFLFQRKLIFKNLYNKCLKWQEMVLSGLYNEVSLSPERKQIYKEIEMLYELKTTGAITLEEYNEKKQKLLEKI